MTGSFRPAVLGPLRSALRAIVLLCVLSGARGFCAQYYCDPATGSMSNPGTAGSPWSTLQAVFVAKKTFAAGDVIYLRSGDHGFPVISTANSGDVTITKQSGHDPVVNRIDFDKATHWVLEGVKVYTSAPPPDPSPLKWPVYPVYNDSLLRITNRSSYITIRNCTVYSATDTQAWTSTDWNTKAWTGIYMKGGSHHLIVQDCEVKNVNFAIHMDRETNHLAITKNKVANFCGDGIRANCDDLTIEYNDVRDAYATNGNHYDLIQGFASARVVIRGNILINTTTKRPLVSNAQGIGSFDGWMDDWVVENNLVVSAHWHGITLLGARNSRVVNNTVVVNPLYEGPARPWITIARHRNGTKGTGNVMNNNFSAVAPRADFPVVGTSQNSNVVSTDYTAFFVDYAGFGFRLKPTSPLMNVGTTADAPAIDLNKDPRIVPYDVGCYEFR